MKNKFVVPALLATVLLVTLHTVAIKHTLYWSYPWFDLLVHFTGGVALASLVLLFLINNKPVLVEKDSKVYGITIIATLLLATAWEIFEYKAGITFASNNYAADTFFDIIMTFIGSLATVRFTAMFSKNPNNGFRTK